MNSPISSGSGGPKKKIAELIPQLFTWKNVKDYSLLLLGGWCRRWRCGFSWCPVSWSAAGSAVLPRLSITTSTFPIGVMVLVEHTLFILGWRYLGGRRFAARTAVSVAAFSFFTDLLVFFIPAAGMTDDNFLNAIYGAVLLGIGLGLVYRGSGTSGGSDILGTNSTTGLASRFQWLT